MNTNRATMQRDTGRDYRGHVLRYGAHRGRTLGYIYDRHPRYLLDLATHFKLPDSEMERVQQAIADYLAEHGAFPEKPKRSKPAKKKGGEQ